MKVDGSIWKRNGIDFLREKTKHRDKIISHLQATVYR